MEAPERVLVVTGGFDHLEGVVGALEVDGVTVVVVETAAAALSELAGVESVVTAAQLPDGDGIELAEEIDDRAADVPVVLVPESGDEALAAAAVGAPVDEYVPEGTDPDAVAETVVSTAAVPAAGDGGTVGRFGDEVSFDLKERAMDAAPVGITITDPNREDNPLVYVNDGFEEMTGYPEAEVIGRNCRFLQGPDTEASAVADIARAVEEDEPITVELKNYTREGEPFWNRLDIAPLRQDGEVTHYVGFQSDSTKRKRAEEAAQLRADQLGHLLERIDGLLSEATTVLVSARSRSEIDTEITTLLAETDPYLGAWVGTPDYTAGTLSPDAAVGVDESALAPIEEDLVEGDGEAASSHGVRVPDDVECVALETLPVGPRRDAAPDEATTLVTIPLRYGDAEYGVMFLYAPDEAAPDGETEIGDPETATAIGDTPDRPLLDDREVAILGSLGDMVGAGIDAVETKRIIASTEVVRLAFDIGDPSLFFVGLSAAADARLEYVGSSFAKDDHPSVSFTITGGSVEAIESFAADHEAVVGVEVVAETEEEILAEFTVDGPSILSLLADYGAECRSITVSGGVARLEAEAPQGGQARQLVEALTDRFADTSLAVYREAERTDQTRPEFAAMLREELTDRQYTALQRAHASDFFEWPRPVSGGELADSMDISRPTFHQHLRAALRKLVTAFFQGTEVAPGSD